MSPVNHLSNFLFAFFPYPSCFHSALPSLRVYAHVYTICISVYVYEHSLDLMSGKDYLGFFPFFCDEMPGKKQQERRRFRLGSYLKDKVYHGREVTAVGTCG